MVSPSGLMVEMLPSGNAVVIVPSGAKFVVVPSGAVVVSGSELLGSLGSAVAVPLEFESPEAGSPVPPSPIPAIPPAAAATPAAAPIAGAIPVPESTQLTHQCEKAIRRSIMLPSFRFRLRPASKSAPPTPGHGQEAS